MGQCLELEPLRQVQNPFEMAFWLKNADFPHFNLQKKSNFISNQLLEGLNPPRF